MSQIDIIALLKKWTAGDEDAATDIFERYSRRLTALAEKHLSPKLAQRLEGRDIVQSAFHSFFRRSARGEFQVDASSNLWQLLVTITMAKVRSQARRHAAEKRNVQAEAADGQEWLSQIAAAGPSVEDAAILVEQIDLLLTGLPETYAEILRLRLNGESRSDIAGILGISRQTVHRALNLMWERLQKSEADGEEVPAGP